jgi:hypothetical protein
VADATTVSNHAKALESKIRVASFGDRVKQHECHSRGNDYGSEYSQAQLTERNLIATMAR